MVNHGRPLISSHISCAKNSVFKLDPTSTRCIPWLEKRWFCPGLPPNDNTWQWKNNTAPQFKAFQGHPSHVNTHPDLFNVVTNKTWFTCELSNCRHICLICYYKRKEFQCSFQIHGCPSKSEKLSETLTPPLSTRCHCLFLNLFLFQMCVSRKFPRTVMHIP